MKQKVADGLWKLGKVNHIAIAVPNIEKAAHFYNKVLGATVSEKHVSDLSCFESIMFQRANLCKMLVN